MRTHTRSVFVLLLALLALWGAGVVGDSVVLAQAGGCTDPGCIGDYDLPPIVIPGDGDDGGGGGGGNDGGGSDDTPPPPPEDEVCTPGTHVEQEFLDADSSFSGTCQIVTYEVDNCTGEVVGTIDVRQVACPPGDDGGDDDFVCEGGFSLGDDGFTIIRRAEQRP